MQIRAKLWQIVLCTLGTTGSVPEPSTEHLWLSTVINWCRSLATDDQPPAVKPISAESTIAVDGMLAVIIRWLVYHDAEVVVAFGAFSSEIFGHAGRYIAEAGTEANVCFGADLG